MSTAALITFGCKFNQVESSKLTEALARAGLTLCSPEGPADAFIINSCTVTAASDQRCRKLLRQLRRKYPEATLVVTGCYAEAQQDAVSALQEVDLIVGNREKSTLVQRLKERLVLGEGEGARAGANVGAGEGGGGAAVSSPSKRPTSRAFLAIQNGCDCQCSYCIVPRARGPSRSKTFNEVLSNLRACAHAGYSEVVLTGINLGCYGKDFDPASSLSELLHRTRELGQQLRLRLSSLEPAEVDPSLQAALTLEHVCPHIHLPVQSGSDRILAAMKRPYGQGEIRALAEALVREQPSAALGADIMVGFPGESEADFELTLQMLRELPFSYFHVFQYSPRPGTTAATLSDNTTERDKTARSQRVRELGHQKWQAFQAANLGKVLRAVVARKRDPATGRLLTLTGNYLRVYIPEDRALIHQGVRVRVEEQRGALLLGSVVSQ